jgi:hypothetical protein
MADVALGFSVHSGWAVAVALQLLASEPLVLLRRQVTLADPRIPGSKQPYHAGEFLPLPEAQRIFERCRASTAELSLQELASLKRELQTHTIRCAAMLTTSQRRPGTVAEIRRVHSWMHAAEGQFFREAIMTAAESLGMPVAEMPERDVVFEATSVFGMGESDLQLRLTQLGQAVGRPWRKDEKLAALAAWLSLTSAQAG